MKRMMSEEITESGAPTLYQLSRKLESIGKIEKCEGCGCYVDTIKEFDAVLNQSDNDELDARSASQIIDELKTRHTTMHGCIGCDPCFPVAVSNALYVLNEGKGLDGLDPSEFGKAVSECDASSCCEAPVQAPVAFDQQPARGPGSSRPGVAWPIEAGSYRLGNKAGCVAIATLASEELYVQFSESVCDEACAICGKVLTENIGIEKVVKNIIANPHIRFLVLCGREAKGHLTGACIKALHVNGLNGRGRIADAPGKRPYIRSLTRPQIARFQRQVEIVDLIGCEDVTAIEGKARELSEHNPGVMADAVIAEGVPHHIASDKVRLQLDKSGFFIIYPKPEANWLMVEHYKNSGEPTCVIEGTDPAVICAEIINRGLISQLDHAAYLGRELERARLSIKLGFAFKQDRAVGELETSADW